MGVSGIGVYPPTCKVNTGTYQPTNPIRFSQIHIFPWHCPVARTTCTFPGGTSAGLCFRKCLGISVRVGGLWPWDIGRIPKVLVFKLLNYFTHSTDHALQNLHTQETRLRPANPTITMMHHRTRRSWIPANTVWRHKIESEESWTQRFSVLNITHGNLDTYDGHLRLPV